MKPSIEIEQTLKSLQAKIWYLKMNYTKYSAHVILAGEIIFEIDGEPEIVETSIKTFLNGMLIGVNQNKFGY